MNAEYLNLIYTRAKEVQPQIKSLVKAFEEEGLTQEEILLEISVALINEGYRLKCLSDGISITEEINTQEKESRIN